MTLPCPPPASGALAPKKRRQGHALFNQHQSQELNKAKKICAAALGGKHRAALQARGITEAFIAGLAADIGLCQQKSSEAMQQTILKESFTAVEGQAKKALLKSMTEIQSAAKQKYARSKPVMLQDYCVGKDLDASRAALEQYSQNILQKLGGEPPRITSDSSRSESATGTIPPDALPGITSEKVTLLSALRSKWLDTQASQANSQALATSLRTERDRLIQTITDKRIQIQFAAEAEWPAREPANAGQRRAFHLQANRPFSLAA